MKNSKISLKSALLAAIFGLMVFFSACSENNPFGPSVNEITPEGLPNSSITVEPYWVGNVLMFRLKNNSRDTIVNDFHVQFDTTAKITGQVTMLGWLVDQNTTDTGKGRLGVKAGPQGQPIQPMGGVGSPAGVQLKLTGNTRKPRGQWWDFTWQATRNGVVVTEGKGEYPPR